MLMGSGEMYWNCARTLLTGRRKKANAIAQKVKILIWLFGWGLK
jgi:hypothetical protein